MRWGFTSSSTEESKVAPINARAETVATTTRSGRPFGFAGIRSFSRAAVGTRFATCAIVTCTPNELMAPIHNRMPVILPFAARERWLDPSAAEGAFLELLRPLVSDTPANRSAASSRGSTPGRRPYPRTAGLWLTGRARNVDGHLHGDLALSEPERHELSWLLSFRVALDAIADPRARVP
jgi:putative SOS response-associated peptidase YedK